MSFRGLTKQFKLQTTGTVYNTIFTIPTQDWYLYGVEVRVLWGKDDWLETMRYKYTFKFRNIWWTVTLQGNTGQEADEDGDATPNLRVITTWVNVNVQVRWDTGDTYNWICEIKDIMKLKLL